LILRKNQKEKKFADHPTVGVLIPDDENPPRDAIHIAVVAVTAGGYLTPGERIGFSDKANLIVNSAPQTAIGIVDPYLKEAVWEGKKFYMFLLPNTITSLNHNWTHPAFQDVTPAAAAEAVENMRGFLFGSRKFMEDFASKIGVTYDELMAATNDYVNTGAYWSDGDKFMNTRLPDDFWKHYEIITRSKVEAEDQDNFFSCSC
jgi:hypothetical protein